MITVKRGDLWWTDLRPHIGHEQTKIRPTLVVSNDRMHTSGLTVVIPLTGTPGPMRAEIENPALDKISYAQADQIRTVSVERMSTYIGTASAEQMSAVERFLRYVLVLPERS